MLNIEVGFFRAFENYTWKPYCCCKILPKNPTILAISFFYSNIAWNTVFFCLGNLSCKNTIKDAARKVITHNCPLKFP